MKPQLTPSGVLHAVASHVVVLVLRRFDSTPAAFTRSYISSTSSTRTPIQVSGRPPLPPEPGAVARKPEFVLRRRASRLAGRCRPCRHSGRAPRSPNARENHRASLRRPRSRGTAAALGTPPDFVIDVSSFMCASKNSASFRQLYFEAAMAASGGSRSSPRCSSTTLRAVLERRGTRSRPRRHAGRRTARRRRAPTP